MDYHIYCHRLTNHPKHTKTYVIYSQAVRYHRICSEEKVWDIYLNTHKTAFTKQQPSTREVDCIMEWVTRITREKLLQYGNKIPFDCTPLVVIYHPTLEPMRGIIKQLQTILNGDYILKDFFPEPPLLAFKQPLQAHHQKRAPHRRGHTNSKWRQNKSCKT